MGVRALWDNPARTVIRYELTGNWTWEEFYLANEQSRRLLLEVDYVVHFIVIPDAVAMHYIPTNAITHIISIWRKAPANTGVTVIIHQNPLVRPLLVMLRRLNHRIGEKYHIATGEEAARTILAQYLTR
ncbi:MAG: hypothetical protein MUE40_15395 [Anaerolineae bacterium]|jgi:hypothetical protein|nr:hypothetical protein [Anaerolineae bacterium]